MRIVSVQNPNAIRLALEIIRKGGVVVYPTETAYGLGGDWTDRSVHARIRKMKGRERGKLFSIIVSSRAMARKYANFPKELSILARKFWPGPLSLVLPLRRGKGTVSVRVSPHPVARGLVQKFGKPLIATSANISGAATLYDARAIAQVFAQRKHAPDLIINAGRLKRVKPSTVVAMEGGKMRVLREGPIKVNSKFKS